MHFVEFVEAVGRVADMKTLRWLSPDAATALEEDAEDPLPNELLAQKLPMVIEQLLLVKEVGGVEAAKELRGAAVPGPLPAHCAHSHVPPWVRRPRGGAGTGGGAHSGGEAGDGRWG